MSLIVISNETISAKDAEVVNQLFEARLERFHLRCPGLELEETETWLKRIDESFHPRIMVHDHHELALEMQLGGIHFPAELRKILQDDLVEIIELNRMLGRKVSTSFHDPTEFAESDYDYAFLSPVFDSVSKPDYKGKGFSAPSSPHPVIALGGVTVGNITEVKTLGYNGAAVLGAIWHAANPVEAYIELAKKCSTVFG